MLRDNSDTIAVKMCINGSPFLPKRTSLTCPIQTGRSCRLNKAAEVREANKKVLVELGKKRPSSHHDPELRTRIGRFAASSGNKADVDKYSKEVGRPASESTVRGMKKTYYLAVQQRKENQ